MLSGTLPYGARTFLPLSTLESEIDGDCLVDSSGAVYCQKAREAIEERLIQAQFSDLIDKTTKTNSRQTTIFSN